MTIHHDNSLTLDGKKLVNTTKLCINNTKSYYIRGHIVAVDTKNEEFLDDDAENDYVKRTWLKLKWIIYSISEDVKKEYWFTDQHDHDREASSQRIPWFWIGIGPIPEYLEKFYKKMNCILYGEDSYKF